MEHLNSTNKLLIEIFREHCHLCILTVVTLFLFIYVFVRGDRNKKLPPGPKGIPLLGYLSVLGKDPHITLNNLAKKYGNVFGFYIGRKYVVVCNDWESKKDAFNNAVLLSKPQGGFAKIPNGFGFGSSNGPEWAEQRKYSTKAIKEVGLGQSTWEDILQEEVNDTIKSIENYKGKPVDVQELFSVCFTNSVMAFITGHSLPFGHPDTKFLSRSMSEITIASPPFAFSVFFPSLSTFLTRLGLYGSSEVFNMLINFTTYIETTVKKCLREKDNAIDPSFIKIYNEAVENNERLQLKNSFSETSLYGNSQTLLLGGSDTSKDSVIWLMIAMAQFPDVQSKIHKELDDVIGKDGSVKYSERNKIPYTHACLLESFRWSTLVPLNSFRMAAEDTEIRGYHIPKGTYVTANHWAIHNDPKYWPHPEKFDPGRFLSNDGKQVNSKPEGFTPFSLGKRNCPGELVAMASILQYFTKLMQRFTILPTDGREVKYDVILGLTAKPSNFKLRLVPRE